MNEEQIKRQFSARIHENYESFLKEWLSQEPEELVSCAEEIAATKLLAEKLPDIASTVSMEYLLHYENPLEVVCDGWLSYDCMDIKDELSKTLQFIQDNSSIWEEYAKVPESAGLVDNSKPSTVRELLEMYPDDCFNMMTPGGFVYLSSEEAYRMLAGESTLGNPGCSGCDMEVSAEELLPQKIQSPSYENGTWHCLSYYEPELEQQPTVMEQGVTMC